MIVSEGTAGAMMLLVAHIGCATLAAVHALLTKPDPRGAFGWIVVCWLFPIGGPALYVLFGINRVRSRARRLKVSASSGDPQQPPASGNDLGAHLARIGDAVTQWSRVPGNAIRLLENGENAFPPMLAAIQSAEQSVWLATYIFETDAIGQEFIRALAAAAQRGVQVRTLVDGLGEWYSWPHATRLLRRAGVNATRFLPPRLLPPRLALNLRNHRKVLVVDQRVAFVGGMNIGGREVGKASKRRMSDLHFEVNGPVVTQIAQSFRVDWRFAAREELLAADPPGEAGDCVCRVITDGPDEDNEKLHFVILGAISAARRAVWIMTPYFIPSLELASALQAAALRGVSVRLVLPERSNLRYVDWACRRWLPGLLERGVEIYLQPPPFSHTKLLVVDDSYAQIGSANLDPRSLRLNFEIAIEIYDGPTCTQLADFIASARTKASRYTLEMSNRRRLGARVRDSLCWLLSPYL